MEEFWALVIVIFAFAFAVSRGHRLARAARRILRRGPLTLLRPVGEKEVAFSPPPLQALPDFAGPGRQYDHR